MTPGELESQILSQFEAQAVERSDALLELLVEFRQGLNEGKFRVAEPVGDRWRVNVWVKCGIILHRLAARLEARGASRFDFDSLPDRILSRDDEVRFPAGGSQLQDGVFVGRSCSIMSPATVLIGARIAPGAVVDAHCLIGACTQVEEGARIGPGSVIGGVIQPLAALPTIIGQGAILAGNCGIYDGVVIERNVYLAPGVQLTSRTRVFDLVKREFRVAEDSQPLTIPAHAVVVQATRLGSGGIAEGTGLGFVIPVIVAYSDDPNFTGDPYQNVF